jgi:hypothetical protein
MVATPSSEPLLGSPRSLVLSLTPRPIVLSPPQDLSPRALPPTTHPFSGVEEDLHAMPKASTMESQEANLATESLGPFRDLLAHKANLTRHDQMNQTDLL